MIVRPEFVVRVLALLAFVALPASAENTWSSKSSPRQSGTSGLAATNLATLGARMARRLNGPRPASRTVASLQPVASGPATSWRVHRRQGRQTPAFIRASTGTRPAASKPLSRSPSALSAPSAMALELLAAHTDIFGLQHPRDELQHLETIRGDDGSLRVRFTRRVEGVPVWGEDLVVHMDSRGQLFAFNGVYSATPAGVPVSVIDAEEALVRVGEHLSARQKITVLPTRWRHMLEYDGPAAEHMLLASEYGRYRPVWRVEVKC